ncbi:NAD(P)-binding domain-containing protein [Knoellia locipacati]|uniref:Flavoprotein n=1 Tax=Knoellia locipacati TaxID=882824 RepID=A0A512T093_9MICO|nr:FAD-dependent oxidoreductase [Knoellia locipacati]GEQ13637.1 flavoprotein [Knoellia locipacati]
MNDVSEGVAGQVVVIGAGPVGLAAAAHLVERGLDVTVLEQGERAAAAVRQWGHVRLFSQWSELVDPAARRLLLASGWTAPAPDAYPTGHEWAEAYLEPLAAALGERVRYGSTVTGVARRGRDRVVDAGRAAQPFAVHVDTGGRHERLTAVAVIDASGTFGSPGPLGGDGYPADGERAASTRVAHRIPDAADPLDAARYGGRMTAVVGAGHSALTALVALSTIAERVPGTEVVWVLRRGGVGSAFGGGDADELPARGALGRRARRAVADGHIRVVTGFRTASVEIVEGTVTLRSEDGAVVEGLDEVVGLTGFRPDHSFLSELRLDLDVRLEAPVRLAPLIDPNVHSCGTVYPHGAAELAHEGEPGVYLVGMKSYGRAPTFLAMTGYEQVRSVVASIAGDHEAAAKVELVLPETGVCGGAGLFDAADDSAGGCCTPATPQLIQLGVGGGRASSC